MTTLRALLASAVVTGVLAATTATANAQSIIKTPGDHPKYSMELEPHAVLGWGHLYRGQGIGIGARLTIPIIDNGFVKSINNSVGISFGVDWMRYGSCYYYDDRRDGYGCGASYFTFPVAMQWNFWFTPKWSAFWEPGLYVYHGVYDDYCDGRDRGRGFCGYPTRTGVDIAMFVGGRYNFNETIALTLRLGYPSSSFGLSFFF